MQVSVLMGTLAREGWDQSLRSMLDQSVPPDEVLVVVDRDTGAAERAALEAAWPSVRFLFNDTNIGLTASLNRGLAAANGEFVFRMDDDDLYPPNRIERQLACFAETGADFVSSWGEGAREGSTRTYVIRAPQTDAAIKRALLRRNILLHPALAFRRATVERIGGYDETFRFAQDYALYLAAIRAGASFAVVPEPLIRRSYGAGSITVGKRHIQAMYSCAARVLHAAATGDRRSFFRTVRQYTALIAAPDYLRKLRRSVFSIVRRGA